MYLFIYFWLHWVPAAVRRLPPAAASGGHSPLRCLGSPPRRPPPLWSTGSRRTGFSSCGTQAQQLWLAGSAVVVPGPSRSAAQLPSFCRNDSMLFPHNPTLKVFLNFRIGVRNLGVDTGKLFLAGSVGEGGQGTLSLV